MVTAKVYGHIWQKARATALTKAQQASPLAARAGHSVEVLWRVYAGCIDGHEQLWNRRIDQALDEDPDDPS